MKTVPPLATLVAALFCAAPALAGPSRWVIVRSHLSPNDARYLHIEGDELVVTTAAGKRWSVCTERLVEAVSDPKIAVVPRWRSSAAPSRDATLRAKRPVEAGFRQSSRIEFLGEDFVGTVGGGLFRQSTGRVPDSPDMVNALAVVKGLLIIGHPHGLSLFDGQVVVDVKLEGPPVASVTALSEIQGVIWAGSFDRGLTRYESGEWSSTLVPEQYGGSWINSLCSDGDSLWVGSSAGLGRRNPDGDLIETVSAVEGGVLAVRRQSGRLTVVTGGRVWLQDGSDWETVDLPGEALHSAVLVDGELWVAGMRGVLHRRGRSWQRFSELNGKIPDSWVTALVYTGSSLWAGTYDAGLLRRDGRGEWHRVLSDTWVNPNALEPLPNGLAVGTMGDGLLVLDAALRSKTTLSTADGLPSDNVTALHWAAPTLWVGTDAGIAEVVLQD